MFSAGLQPQPQQHAKTDQKVVAQQLELHARESAIAELKSIFSSSDQLAARVASYRADYVKKKVKTSRTTWFDLRFRSGSRIALRSRNVTLPVCVAMLLLLICITPSMPAGPDRLSAEQRSPHAG